MFTEYILGHQARLLKTDEQSTSFALEVRLNWFTSLTLSAIEALTLAVDGQRIDAQQMLLRIEGSSYPVSALGECTEAWWFVAEPATLECSRAGALEAGRHLVELTIRTRIPYFGPAPDQSFASALDVLATAVMFQ